MGIIDYAWELFPNTNYSLETKKGGYFYPPLYLN
jgi:hypothetical protein